MRKLTLIYLAIAVCYSAGAQNIEEIECNEKWIQKIESLAPASPEVPPEGKHQVLIFDLFTGFDHWVTPHSTAVIELLGNKSGAYKTDKTKDISAFTKKNLRKYDAVVLNNNCSDKPRRDLFYDALGSDSTLSEDEKIAEASRLEKNLIDYVKGGGGLMVLHGAIVMQNNSMEFSRMCGGSFDYHPKQQEVTIELVDRDHPLVNAFEGKPFVHVDEPYFFMNAYEEKDFHPLLYMETARLEGKRKNREYEDIAYVSWIRRHGKGRVFYVSPSHNAQSYEDPRLLKFFLDGAQYVLGDIQCDDSPMIVQ